MAVTAQPIGILLPITDGPAGFFQQSFDVISQVRSNIVMLFSTKKGERRMNLRFGSDLWNLLFEFNDDNLNQIVESTVTRDMATWMPYVKVQNISVTNGASEINQHTVNIAVAFTVPSVGITTPQTIRFTMQQGHS